MKTMKNLLFVAFAATTIIACQKEMEDNRLNASTGEIVTFTAYVDNADTKTAIYYEDGVSSFETLFTSDDVIAVNGVKSKIVLNAETGEPEIKDGVTVGIYDTMQLVNCDVATICTGMAASMGAVLLTAGAAGKRQALPHSRIMIHQPLGGVQGQASDIEITAREIARTKRELYEILSEHSGKSIADIERDADRDYWLSAAEAKEYGLIDGVLSKHSK